MAKLPPPQSLTIEAIYNAYEADSGDGFRPHLGASLIGKECERALWLDFRWATRQHHPGRLLRLFETGQREEDRLVANLRRIGVTIMDINPETGRQWQVEAHGGHFGGSLDGVALGVPEAPKTWHVCEFKTHNIKSFKELQNKGVLESKPQHYAQMQVYMRLTGMTRALYLAVCKDTDALYAERVPVDRDIADRLVDKAGRIIFAERPPEKINEDPAWWVCRMCDHHPLCHERSFADVNCRTCMHASAMGEGWWMCETHGHPLEVAKQKEGCDDHLFIPDLVPGKQVDVDPNAGTVTYQLPDGNLWCNVAGGGAPC
ncbi:oxidoreductase [Magnetococcus sp. PR-3]|uniref:oxidoreductase n=1 Tax=Magnetococcus sp. PR-3 TaxID=3120355 RepID=UPI002FCE3898